MPAASSNHAFECSVAAWVSASRFADCGNLSKTRVRTELRLFQGPAHSLRLYGTFVDWAHPGAGNSVRQNRFMASMISYPRPEQTASKTARRASGKDSLRTELAVV